MTWAKSTWQETRLETHDIAFSAKGNGNTAVIRGILISSAEAGAPKTGDRLERLRLLNGGCFVFVILLLNGDDPMGALLKQQMEFAVPSRGHL